MAPQEEGGRLTAGLLARGRRLLARRSGPTTLALLVELVLLVALLTLGRTVDVPKPKGEAMTSIAFTAETSAPAREKPSAAGVPTTAKAALVPQPQPSSAVAPPVASQPPALILVPKDTMAALDISRLPRSAPATPASPKAMYGPAAPAAGSAGGTDSAVVGLAPDGSPLYAARWVHEPYDSELRGYLSTASGPGWGMIACRTVAGQRVEDCEVLDESPSGSRIAAAAAGAAWQYRVWPPRKNGQYLVGSWVRIRITYGVRQKTYGP